MANITYKLFDPATKQYVLLDGKETKTTTASKQQIEDYARKEGLQVNYLQTAADYAMPKFDMGDIGMTTAADVAATTPSKTQQDGTVMTPTQKAAADISPIEAAAGGFLTGLTKDFRDEIFGSKDGVNPAEAEKMAQPGVFEASKFVGGMIPEAAIDAAIMGATRGRLGMGTTAALGGALSGLVEGIGAAPPLTDIGAEEAADIGASTIGGAAGGVVGQKVLAPLFKKGAKYLKSKLPEFGIPEFRKTASPETKEEELGKIAKSAQTEMVGKEALEKKLDLQLKGLDANKKIKEKIKDLIDIEDVGEEQLIYSAQQAADIFKKKIADMNLDELVIASNLYNRKFLKYKYDINKLVEGIAESNKSIAEKEAAYKALRSSLENAGNLSAYLRDFKSSVLGRAVGSQAGVAAGMYSTKEQEPTSSVNDKYTVEALKSLLMPK